MEEIGKFCLSSKCKNGEKRITSPKHITKLCNNLLTLRFFFHSYLKRIFSIFFDFTIMTFRSQ